MTLSSDGKVSDAVELFPLSSESVVGPSVVVMELSVGSSEAERERVGR